MLKQGDYVVDRSASGRYHQAVYRVVGPFGSDQTVVRYVGSVVGGRLEYTREQPVTHRMTENLRQWR
jgi:hypothetical protein